MTNMALFKGQYVVLIFGLIVVSTVCYYYYHFTNSLKELLENHSVASLTEIPTRTVVASLTEIPTRPVVIVKTKELGRDLFFLVVLVLSRPSGKESRDAIRQTWIKGHRERAQGVLVKFSIGTEGISTQIMDDLALEESIYGDLLLLPHLKDSYNNLTRKILQSFVEINSVYDFSYLLKCDDDMFIVLNAILGELAQRENKKGYYWGKMYESAPILKTGRYAEKEWDLCDNYIPYASGGGYILSQNLVMHIAFNSDVLRLYHNEDVSVGVWISPYDIDRHNDFRFNAGYRKKCNSSDIVIHGQTIKDMILRQKSYDEHKVIC